MQKTSVVMMPVQKKDISLVSEWTKEWLGAAHPLAYSLTIFSSPGYTDFVRNQLETGGPVKLIGAYDGPELLGFIELRRLPDELFINNFCVKSEARGRKVGEALLAHTEQLAKALGAATVGLDCFLWNERALQKYKLSGYRETGRIGWLTSPNRGHGSEAEPFFIKEKQKADAHHHAFGFSQFFVETAQGPLSVNRLKETYFRVAAKDHHPAYDNILAQIDPRRELFMIWPGHEAAPDGWKKASDSVKLEKRIH